MSVWTFEMIEKDITACMAGLNLKRMPSRSEINNYYGNDRLTNKISKTLGYYGWAKKLGLKMQECDTQTGKNGEAYVAELLSQKGHDVEKMTTKHPYDLLIDGAVKIDVKTAHMYKGKNGNFYSFNLHKKYPTCDVYALVAINETSEVYIIPSKDVLQTQISMGEHQSVYHKYKNRWDIIDFYCTALKGVI